MSFKNITIISSALLIALVMLLLTAVYQAREIQQQILEREQRQFNSTKLAHELFQSSEDLTRMARAYAITGDPVYKTYFYKILGIRNGQLPRPYDFSATYWHLEGIGKLTTDTSGETIALIDLMRREGLSIEELRLLRESQSLSDRLVAVEQRAFAAIEGWLDNGHGEFTVKGEPDKELAQSLLWSEEYINEKAKIMLPLKRFWTLLHDRTQAELDDAQNRLTLMILFEAAITLLILLILVSKIFYTRRYVLDPLDNLTKETNAIANGLYYARCKIIGNNELTKLGTDFNRMAHAIQHTISLHDQTRHLLQQKEARLKEAQKIAQIGNWELDLSDGTLHWSDEIFVIFEIDKAIFTASYDAFLKSVHPEDREKVDQAYQHSLETREPYEIKHRLLFPKGRIKWVNERCCTYYDDNGKPIRSVGTVQDITEQMKTENTLHLYASVFERSGEAIIITNEQNEILATNEAFHKLTGFNQQEAVGKNPYTLVAAKSTNAGNLPIWRNLAENSFWQGEMSNRHKNGYTYTAWLSITAVRNAEKKITNYIASFTDITEHKAALDRIQHLAHHDMLTDLPNRLSLTERLKQAVSTAQRNKEKIGLMFIDLDRFKIINDTLGHHIGDLLLIEVSQRLKSCVRSNDIVARLGGDEFVVVLLELKNIDATFPIADKILSTIGEPYVLEGHQIHSSPSIGIAFYPDSGNNIDDVMKKADIAMYHAKSKGRNNYQFFESSMNLENFERLELEHDMRIALEREEFILHYQPKIDARSLQIIGVEALIRWQHPKKGLIPPGQFIPLAEISGLMLPLGEWVIKTACRQLKHWHNQGLSNLQMSINLSQRQFHRPNLASFISDIIEQENINPAKLEFEITESMAMDDPQKTIESLEVLRRIGVFFALDDFGTGYSSMSHLKLMPISCLKLDRSYVKDIETNPSDAAICASTISLAHDLGLEVVAEGVETEKQYEYLKTLGCDKFQGYFFSKPLTAPEIEAFIKVRDLKQFSSINSITSANILVIDDDDWTCEFLKHTLESLNHQPTTMLDPLRALELLRKNPFSFNLIMLDMLMPKMSGMDTIKEIREINFDIPIIIVTSYKADAVKKTLRSLEKDCNLLFGINYFILEKPLTVDMIKKSVDNALNISKKQINTEQNDYNVTN